MDQLPLPIGTHEDIWLDMLADDELSSEQANQLFNYLDEACGLHSDVENAWKRCALKLLHERAVAQTLTQLYSPPLDQVTMQNRIRKEKATLNDKPPMHQGAARRNSTGWVSALAAGIAFALGLFVQSVAGPGGAEGPMAQNDPATQFAGQPEDPTDFDNSIRLVNNPNGLKSHTIYEIENTPTEAVFYLSHQLPEIMLQSLVLAGHSVEVGQESVEIQDNTGELVSVPVSRLQIRKFARNTF